MGGVESLASYTLAAGSAQTPRWTIGTPERPRACSGGADSSRRSLLHAICGPQVTAIQFVLWRQPDQPRVKAVRSNADILHKTQLQGLERHSKRNDSTLGVEAKHILASRT